MTIPFDIKGLSPVERIELAEKLWNSLDEEDIELTAQQIVELKSRRDRLKREGSKGRPWREVLDEAGQRGG